MITIPRKHAKQTTAMPQMKITANGLQPHLESLEKVSAMKKVMMNQINALDAKQTTQYSGTQAVLKMSALN